MSTEMIFIMFGTVALVGAFGSWFVHTLDKILDEKCKKFDEQARIKESKSL